MDKAGARPVKTGSNSNYHHRFKAPPENSQSKGHPVGDTNRQIWGTWSKPYDFTLTVIGYMMGIHNFWRFPYLCYKYGGAFFIPFTIILLVVGIPTIFMEFTIGQYFSVGPTEACGQMAPILTGVSYLLAWNSIATCLIYIMMISWARFYSSDASSCLKGWESCNENHHYNTIDCFTGDEDNRCGEKDIINLNPSQPVPIHVDYIFYNFSCVTALSYCQVYGADYETQTKSCKFTSPPGLPGQQRKMDFSIFTSRTNALTEHFYGRVSGMIRKRELMKRKGKYDPKNPEDFKAGLEYVVDEHSRSGRSLKLYSVTSWLLIAIFLYEGLLSVSAVTYVFNTFPFILLLVFTAKALSLPQAIAGIEQLTYGRVFLKDIQDINIWAEAIIQVVGTTGIGNGVLITLATFNRYRHKFLFDIFFTTFLNYLTSACACLICFCTIGHYIYFYRINVPFGKYVHMESSSSSIEFGYIVYTHFLTLIHDQRYAILLFFFMITSFSTDSALRLVQMALDTLVAIFPRLRLRRLSSLLGICALGFFTLIPMTQNGGLVVFLIYEYFTLNFVTPFITLVQIVGFAWIYKASEIMDRAQEMKIISSKLFRLYLVICLKFISPILLMFVLVVKFVRHSPNRFNGRPSEYKLEVLGWIISLAPISILLVVVAEQLIKTKGKWRTLFISLKKQEETVMRHSAVSQIKRDSKVARSGVGEDDSTQILCSPVILKAVKKWRHLEEPDLWSQSDPTRRITTSPASYNPEYKPTKTISKWDKGRRYFTRRAINRVSSSSSHQVHRNDSPNSLGNYNDSPTNLLGPSQQSFREANPGDEKWKRFLLYLLSYFEQWPERFDEDSEDDETDYETEDSV